jgi:post-segregation antitoxin (ccd killing protein)
MWHDCGMARVRLSTTVDSELLGGARELRAGVNDAGLIDEALAALLAQHRATTIDHAYATAYGAQPIGESDDWGDLESFRDAAATAK